MNTPGLYGYYPDKVFPEEVDNIKEYMGGVFSTNVNNRFIDSERNLRPRINSNNPIEVSGIEDDELEANERERDSKHYIT